MVKQLPDHNADVPLPLFRIVVMDLKLLMLESYAQIFLRQTVRKSFYE